MSMMPMPGQSGQQQGMGQLAQLLQGLPPGLLTQLLGGMPKGAMGGLGGIALKKFL